MMWVRVRGLALWCLTTAAAAATSAVALPAAAAGPGLLSRGAGFADVLVVGCAAVTLVATAWLWLTTTDVVVRVVLTRHAGPVVVRRPGRVRLLLLTACGVVVLGATGAPAHADDTRPLQPHSLSGLPLPDRATGDPAQRTERTIRAAQHLVRAGDSLWTIAEQRLGPHATVAEVAGYWSRIHARNAGVIGPDPDLILPGQLLRLPPPAGVDRSHRPPSPLEEDR